MTKPGLLSLFSVVVVSAFVAASGLVKPCVERSENPYHYLLVRVDGENMDLQVLSVDWGSGYAPYRSNKIGLQD
jgi:hypothetical protein